MYKKPMLLISLLTTMIAGAQEKVIQLYTGAAPGSESWNWNEKENDKNLWNTKVVYNVSRPTLTVVAKIQEIESFIEEKKHH